MREERAGKSQVPDTNEELALKILLVGGSRSGKSSLVRRLCDKPFREEYVPTLGFDIAVVPFGTYQGRPVSLHLWDVAGSQLNAQPCHHALIADGADGVVYVMDVTNRDSLQAVDDWDHALAKFLPPWACKLLVGHKADLPAYVVNDEALSLYVAGASGFRGWCLTVGSSEYGDYDVAARRGGGGATADVGGRYKGQSLSGEKQLSVSEAMRMLLGHVFRAGGAGGTGAYPAGFLGLGASAGRATPFPSSNVDAALDNVAMLGLGGRSSPSYGRPSRVETSKMPVEEKEALSVSDLRAERLGERGPSMAELLKRGDGPDPSWEEGAGHLEGIGSEESQASSDIGWRYFAGRMGREEAEALLRGRPEGTFFLRRKGPSMVVLTYVAKRQSASGSGRKSVGSNSPKAKLASPQGERGSRGVSMGGAGRRARADKGRDLNDSTSVQHALLVYEGGFFSDEKGRLGRFPTINELLKSKISALARYPLRFRREEGRYVIVDPSEEAIVHVEDASIPGGRRSLRYFAPSPSNPFAVDDGTVGMVGGGTSASFVASASAGNPFGSREQQAMAAKGTPTAARPSSSSPPQEATPPLPTQGSSPTVKANASHAGADTHGRRAESARLPSSKIKSGAFGGSDWVNSRASRDRRGKSGRVGRGEEPSRGGSLWMEAAAAVEKSGVEGSVGAGTRKAVRRGSLSSGDGRNETGSLSPSLESYVEGVHRGSSAMRRRSRKGSVSSVEDGMSVSSSSVAESADADGRSPQWRGGEPSSTMAVAAEVAAAMMAAKGHPDARKVEERTLAAQAAVDHALAALERQLRPLVVRQAPPRPPLWQSPTGVQRRSRRGLSSGVSSPQRSPSSPMLPYTGDEHKQGPPQQHWVSAAPKGTAAALLASPAALLMQRASSCRQDLLGSVNTLRDRALSIARAEAESSAGVLSAAASARGSLSTSPTRESLPVGRQLFSLPTGAMSDDINTNERRQQVSNVKGKTSPLTGQAEYASRERGDNLTAELGGLRGVSCCSDFERILGKEEVITDGPVTAAANGKVEQLISGSSLPPVSGAAWPSADGSMDVQRSFSGFVSQGERVGGGSLMATWEGRRSGSPGIYPANSPVDAWPAVFVDLATTEKSCLELVAAWNAAGGALKEACEDELEEGDGFSPGLGYE